MSRGVPASRGTAIADGEAAPGGFAGASRARAVITLSEDGLKAAAGELWSLVRKGGFDPDAVLGIATGGVRVAEALPVAPGTVVLSCRMSRPSTAAKQRMGADRGLLRKLPYRLTDRLRLFEDRVGGQRVPPPTLPSVQLQHDLGEVSDALASAGARKVLLVDDALDSGATLACVLTALRERLSADASVRTAVVVTTRPAKHRACTADFTLYEGVLCRFPWSFDYRRSDA